MRLKELKEKIGRFVNERDREQFHSPKNLSMSLAIEAAELMEYFQWTNTVEDAVKVLKDKARRTEIGDEVADAAIYLIDFCNLYGGDLEQAIPRKLKNARKYPAKQVSGKMDKYTVYKLLQIKRRGF